ncbi:methyltransferase domain-containing protein [Pseudonocardia ailaonensis]|uniref:Methyltransferase domain-containing protein n=1 Tax=Pseudonocardia ailaonensis TaxID=367279 RepID=A0ABN2MSQ5_9PSEU
MSAAAGELPGTVSGGAVRRVLEAEVARARAARPERRPRAVDVGGGSGSWAVPLAVAGCEVTVVDVSPDALASLERRAREAGVHGLVTPVQGDADQLAELVGAGLADLVLGHGLLELVDDPARAAAALAAVAAPGAAVSVLATSRHAAVLRHVLAGRLDEARAVLTDPDGRYGPGDALRRRLDGPALGALLEATGRLRVELVQGDGVLEAWLPNAVRDGGPAAVRDAAELEELAAGVPALQEVAARLHVLARALPTA